MDENIIKKLIEEIKTFRDNRDWEKFHTEENLAKSIVIESSELLECFQWGDEVKTKELEDELADILIYSLLLADAIDADVEQIIRNKIKKNKERFPIKKVYGTSGKYTKVD